MKVLSILNNPNFELNQRERIFNNLIEKLSSDKIFSNSKKLSNILFNNWLPFSNNPKIQAKLYSYSQDLNNTNSKIITNLLIHSLIINRNYDKAIKIITSDKSLAQNLDNFILELLSYHLLHFNKLDSFLILINYLSENNFFSSCQILEIAFNKSLDSNNIELCNRLFIGFIYYHPYPLFNLTDGMIYSYSLLCYKNLKLSELDKLKKYKSIRDEHYNDINNKIELNSFNILKFNAICRKNNRNDDIISKGLFYKFNYCNFNSSKNDKNSVKLLSVKDFPKLNENLIKNFPHLSENKAQLLIKQMEGYHINPLTTSFSVRLHPNEQIKRIMKNYTNSLSPLRRNKFKFLKQSTAKLKNNSPLEKYYLKINDPKKIKRFGKPLKMSNRFRMKKIKISNKPFHALSLNIILRLISKTTNDLKLTVQLIKSMTEKRRMKLNDESILYLFKIINNSSLNNTSELHISEFSNIINLFTDIKLNLKTYKLAFKFFIENNNLNGSKMILNQLIKHNLVISNSMIISFKQLCIKNNDNSYESYEPTFNFNL
ncbi:hypothetical protein B5S30_g4963 [[Candida] boidinii]|nr:hypothetical protein B5S30_g4963 [[Candida] boidinii]